MKKIKIYILYFFLAFAGIACVEEEKIDAPVIVTEPSADPLDQYIQQNFVDKYGIAVRYAYVDRFVEPNRRVTPPRRDVVEPMLNFLTEFWIDPFLQVPNGEAFFKRHVPAEVVFIGGVMYNQDGTVTLGTADAGARITLTEVNFLNKENKDWIFRQLGTIYHEFAHIMHQRYNLPQNFQNITPSAYTSSGSWYTLTDEEALRRGFVSPYGTSSVNEDFAEIVAFLLYDPLFYEKYINIETNCVLPDCLARNEGRAKLKTKLNAILTHYTRNTGVDLLKVRALIQQKLQ